MLPGAAQIPMHGAYAGMPPGVASGAQYNPSYQMYSYMPPNAGYHYVHSPYSHYPPQPAGAGFPAQAGNSTYNPANMYPTQQGATTPAPAQVAGAYGDDLLGMQSQHQRGRYKESGLYIPAQNQQGQAVGNAGQGSVGRGREMGLPQNSYYTPGAYSTQGQGGYAQGQYNAQYTQGQYWQNTQVMMPQTGTQLAGQVRESRHARFSRGSGAWKHAHRWRFAAT
eukprot:7945280-Pyramimonas_sp.AAC.1